MNDTQELREQIKAMVDGWWDGEVMTIDHDDLVALMHKREQAAELRGRIDETRGFYSNDEELNQIVRDRLATLQATKPEKG